MDKGLVDYFGKAFKEGQTIAYPVRQGSRLWIESAVITKVHENGLSAVKDTNKKVYIKNYYNCFIRP